ncbi:hypothetical protein [Winogradskyella poriferorum]|uniref:Uncharacterized protein n=1 Tax=Winogradskyella poriferorum TaxID=307627 RepID=A0ABU7WAC7_9FLAO
MDKEILNFIDKDFELGFRESVIKELLSIKLKHVMAESEYNLKNTRMSILYLAKGNLNEVVELTKRAKIDFRDVIMWATQEKELNNK